MSDVAVSGTPSLSVVNARATATFLQKLLGRGRVGEDALDELAGVVEVRRVRRGQRVWSAGDPAAQVMWVRAGVVWVHQGTGADPTAPGAERDVSLGYYGRGALIGAEPGGAQVARLDVAEVHEDATLLVLDRPQLDRWLARHPGAIPAVLDAFADASRRMAARLALLGLPGARARLAGLLLDLAQRFGIRDARGVIVDLRLTHRELAALIGATRETVSVTMVELRAAGLIRSEQRRVIILDEARLLGVAAHGRAA
jgi:CRP/FNR family cyclic AMP-dependent transcriptional regulator